MGETFQNLRAQGKSVVVERQENIVIERSDSNFVKKKHTITREKFRNDANSVNPPRKQRHTTKRSNNTSSGQQVPKNIEPSITLVNTIGTPYSHSKRSEVSLELAVLKQDIDDEIDKLKAIRRFTLQHTANGDNNNNSKYKANKNNNNMGKKQQQEQQNSTTIQNDRTWDQNFTEQNPTNIKYTFEKYSSEHRLRASASATTHNQFYRDEQTSCRPRMRTIGLQKNTQRSASVTRKKDPIFQNSALNLKLNSIDSTIPVTATTYCFDYVPAECNIGDYYNKNGNQQYNNDCCQKHWQRVLCNTKNNNGVVCNQNTYSEKCKTPSSEYKYCCDEVFYNYAPCRQQQQQQQKQQQQMTCCNKPTRNVATCCCHHHNSGRQHIPIGRCKTDLCTDEFYHKTFKCDERIVKCEERKRTSRSPLHRTKEKRLLAAKNERKNELDKAADAKAQERKKRAATRRDGKKLLTTTSEEEHAAKMAELLLMGERSKQKSRLTKKEICRLRKLLATTDDDGECENVSNDGEDELDEDTKRTMEKMRIKEYKPTKPKTTELEVSKFFDQEIAKLTPQQDHKKEKQYDEYIDKYDSKKPVSDLNQDLSTRLDEDHHQGQQKVVEDPESSATQNVELSKTYTRLTLDREQQTENIELPELHDTESRRSFLISRKFSYPEEVVSGKVIPRFDPKGGSGINKSLSNEVRASQQSTGTKSLSNADRASNASESSKDKKFKLAVPEDDESKKMSTSKEDTTVDEKTMEQIVSRISPTGEFMSTSRERDETSSRVIREEFYDSDIRKMKVKRMIQPIVDGKPMPRSSRDYDPSYRQEIQHRDEAVSDCGCVNKTTSTWDRSKTPQTLRINNQDIEWSCEMPEFNGCPCMYDTYLNLIAYLQIGKDPTKDFCYSYRRAKSQL